MAEPDEAGEHTIRLSAIDQASERAYIRYCLCFPCTGNEIDSIANRLTSTVKRTTSNYPILAGRVRSVRDDEEGQADRLEIAVNLKQVLDFAPAIKILTNDEFRQSYRDLDHARVTPPALINDALTTLPEVLNTQSSPVFGLQASFISGGVIVAFHLHHSAADVIGLQTIIKHLSSDLPLRDLTDDDIRAETLEQSRLRDRLSGSRGASSAVAYHGDAGSSSSATDAGLGNPAVEHACHILSFDLGLIEGITAMANEHLHYICNGGTLSLCAFDVLSAILWKGVNRALGEFMSLIRKNGESAISSLATPVDIRKIIEPALEDTYLGNAEIHSITTAEALKLALPFGPSALASVATLIHTSRTDVSERFIRTKIAGMNESPCVLPASKESFCETGKITVTDWTGMILDEADVGLGLGSPAWGRKLGKVAHGDECIVHPVRKHEGIWEVTLQLPGDIMGALLKDESLMTFVKHIS